MQLPTCVFKFRCSSEERGVFFEIREDNAESKTTILQKSMITKPGAFLQ